MTKTIHRSEHLVLAELIRDLRLQANLTQVEVSQHLGMGQSRVSEFERGLRRLDLVELRELAQLYRMSLVEVVAEYEARLKKKRLSPKR